MKTKILLILSICLLWVSPIFASGPYSTYGDIASESSTLNVPQFVGSVYYVDAAQSGDTGDGLTPSTAKKTIGAAITASSAGDAITIKAGSYVEDVDVNKNYVELWPEIGTVITAASGAALTFSGNFCKVWCPGGALKINPVVNGTCVLVTGIFCYVSDVRVTCGSSGDLGFYVGSAADNTNGDGTVLLNCRAASPLIAAFKIQADKVRLEDCCTGGEAADVSIGFWILPDASGNMDKTRLKNCGSQGHITAGYQVDAGCTNGTIENSYSGGGDGKWTDADDAFIWSKFSYDDDLYHTLTFPVGAGSENLFEILGSVNIIYIYGDVHEAIHADVDNLNLELYDGTAYDITGNVDTASAPVGSLFMKTKTLGEAMSLDSAAAATLNEDSTEKNGAFPFIITAKNSGNTYIRATWTGAAGAGVTGIIHWHIYWSPLNEDGFVVAQ